MSDGPQPRPGDQARVSVRVAVEPARAFRIFTEEIDAWWRRGPKYRASGRHPGVMTLEPGVGGRLYETVTAPDGTRRYETGLVTAWEPPRRLVLTWRGVNFARDEKTEVEILFEPRGDGTLVVVTHRGWADIRPDHPARHGKPTAAFIRMVGLWWGELMSAMRERAAPR